MSLIDKIRGKCADIAIDISAKMERHAREREEEQAYKEAKLGLYKLCIMATNFAIMGLRMNKSENEISFYDPFANECARFNFVNVDEVKANMDNLTELLHDTFARRKGYIDVKDDKCDLDMYIKMMNYFYKQYLNDPTYNTIMSGSNGIFNISGKTEVKRYDVDYPEEWTVEDMYHQAGSIFSHCQESGVKKISKKDYIRYVEKSFEHNKAIYKKYHGYEETL